MQIYFIYKQILDKDGLIEKVELVECDTSEQNAHSFSKLYNLQVPADMKRTISYAYMGARVS